MIKENSVKKYGMEKDLWDMPFSAWLFKGLRKIRRNFVLYLFLLPSMLYLFIFNYIPMYGVQIAFKNFTAVKGIVGSPWVGLKYFRQFLESPSFYEIFWNTVILSIYQLVVSFPIPIILALMITYCSNKLFAKFIQNVTYIPHFISIVVLVGMMSIMLSPNSGVVNTAIKALNGQPIFFIAKEEYFRHLYVWSGVWQNMGWSSIIYIATLAGISVEMHESAIVDGASKIKRIIYIDIPSIMPTAVILLILQVGHIMSLGFEKTFLMQNSMNINVSEIIATFVYKKGLLDIQYSYSAAVGLFNNLINLTLLLAANGLSRKFKSTSLF